MSTLGDESADERQMIAMIEQTIEVACRAEGLSPAQADCILAAHGPEWNDGLRECPAFKAKPPSWVKVGPPRADRIRLMGGNPSPDGPREGPTSYRELVGTKDTTCGLTADGAIQCWGKQVPVPEGAFVHLRWQSGYLCGLDTSGHVKCTTAQDIPPDYLPTDELSDFDIADYRGCGVRKRDGSLVCWTNVDDPGLSPPPGSYEQIAVSGSFACARAVDGAVTCFGDDAPKSTSRFRALAIGGYDLCGVARDGTLTCRADGPKKLGAPPSGKFTSASCDGRQCCAIRDDKTLACWGARWSLHEPPAGTFAMVGVFGTHSCAVKAAGGTVCWGGNDAGECTLPQEPRGHHWY